MSGSAQGALVGQKLGKYELLAQLAIGGTSETYLARIAGAAGFEKFVVAKCLLAHLADDPEHVRIFLDEARIGAQLDHSNIVQTLELGEHDGRYYMAMEYLAGMSLSALARRAMSRVPGGLPVDLALYLATQACAGLHYAHERTSPAGIPLGIIHGDVSPQKLIVSFEGELKLVDFGIAGATVRRPPERTGSNAGNRAYRSPEQCSAQALDRRTDIFALGVVLHELLTGHRLFKRANDVETRQAIVKGQVVPPSAVKPALDPGLDEVVMRALALDRRNRYATADALGEALLELRHRRGRSVGASDVARFVEGHFADEVARHRARMRDIITGHRGTGPVDELTWHAPADANGPRRAGAAERPSAATPPPGAEAGTGNTAKAPPPVARQRRSSPRPKPVPPAPAADAPGLRAASAPLLDPLQEALRAHRNRLPIAVRDSLPPPAWMLALAFVSAACVGVAMTLLVAAWLS